MRITFFTLLFMNFVMLLWITQIDASGEDGTPPPVPEENRLVLLREFLAPEQALEQGVAGPVGGIPDIDIIDENSVCFTVGPFKEPDAADKVAEQIAKLDIAADRRSNAEREQYGYRVYLRPYETRDEAIETARQLAELDVEDYFVIGEGDKKNGISLGLFRKKSGAIRRMAEMRKHEFKPSLEIKYREITVYWLDYDDPDRLLNDRLWNRIVDDLPNLRRLSRNCPAQIG